MVDVGELKDVSSWFIRGYFLFTCSYTFALGCIISPQCTVSQTYGQSDNNITMSIMDEVRSVNLNF